MNKIVAVAGLVLAGALPAFAQGIEWNENYDKGIAQSKAEGKAVFLVFYATW